MELAKNDAETCVSKDAEDEFLEIIMAFEDFSKCGEVFYDSVVTMHHEAGNKMVRIAETFHEDFEMTEESLRRHQQKARHFTASRSGF